MTRGRPSGIVAALLLALALAALAAPPAQAAFGIAPGSFFAKAHQTVPLLDAPAPGGYAYEERAADIAGLRAAAPATQAGSHPDATVSFAFDTGPDGRLEGEVKDLTANLPPGFLGDPLAVPACSREAFFATYKDSVAELPLTGGCPVASQVGVATLVLEQRPRLLRAAVPVYRIATAAGSPASFGIPVLGFGILLDPHLRSGGDYGLSIGAADVNASIYYLAGSTVTLWGVPAAPEHDPERFDLESQEWGERSQGEPRPFLLAPSDCASGPLDTSLTTDSWQEAGRFLPTDPADPGYNSASPEPTGCERLHFGGPSAPASLTFQPAIHAADTPSAYEARLTLPFDENPAGLADPPLRDITVALPEGVRADPASARGLGACTEAQIGFLGAGFPAPRPLRFDEAAPGCPDASKIGTVTVNTPLLEAPLAGSVYLATPEANPFGSLLAIYLAIDDPAIGIVVKLAGRVAADPGTGRLTATFTDNPQLPFTELDLRLFGGPGAPLANPQTCGTKTTASTLVPWSAPASPAVSSVDSFQIDSGAGGGACAAEESQLPARLGFEAGTETPLAGAFSPFLLRLSRDDGTQRIASLEATLPEGLLARLAGIPYCPEADLAAAQERPGRAELSAPSCPAASRVGSVRVAAGAGPEPVEVEGGAYLAGPYRGAPLSLAIVTPAVAGPFDLGTVVVRAALEVDESSARVHAVSDPIPQILDGIPLDLRRVTLDLDRGEFTVNPTGCRPQQITAGAVSSLGRPLALQSPFGLGGCRGLGFGPRLKLVLSGHVRRRGHPAIKAVLTRPPGAQANLAAASVVLPKGYLIDNAHVSGPCTRIRFAEGPGRGERCPPRSVLGTARAWSPLLSAPLEGKVYFRSNGGERTLPDMVAQLDGQVSVSLVGFIDSVRRKGSEDSRVRVRFLGLPDAPVSRFELRLAGGRRGLVIDSVDLCADRAEATLRLRGQNGATSLTRARPQVRCHRRKAMRARHARAGPGGAE